MTNDEQMDLWLWSQGVCQWHIRPYRKTSTVPHELDYLRGIHDSAVLAKAAAYLSRRTRQPVRLRTMWQDKHVYVKPAAGNRRELADLGVILTRQGPGGIDYQTMWLLQAKVSDTPLSPFVGPSSAKEIELFEGVPGPATPEFKLLKGRKRTETLAPVFPAGAFGGSQHWSFVTLQRDPGIAGAALRERWPGSSTPSIAHQSLFAALVEVINGSLGVPVKLPAQPTDHWSILFECLMAHAIQHPTSGHAKSGANPPGNVMQFSPLQQAASTLQESWHFWPNRLFWRQGWPSGLSHGGVRTTMASSDFLDPGSTWSTLDAALHAQAFGPGDPDRPDAGGVDPEPTDIGLPFIVFIDVREPRQAPS